MYYVYEWFIKDTNEIFYVGKGSGNRYKNYWDRNQIFKDYYERNQCDVRIIKEFDNEKDAFEYEKARIDELKQNDLCKANIHIGGAGGSGEYWTDELRQEYSENNVMKRPEQRLRMSINNPMKDPEVAKHMGVTHARHVIINGVEYNSVNEVMEKYNTGYDTVKNWCIKGINIYGEQCRFVDQEQVEFTDIRYNKGYCKGVIYKGKLYEAEIDLCNDINISTRTITEWLKRGFDPEGNPCRYIDDNREDLVFVNRHVARNKNRAKKVYVNNILYKSVEEASQILNISKTTIYSYLQGIRHNPKYICTYDNQQPSQENSGNSILEGSTTNG